jgi:VWFA-related protein
LTTLVRTVAIMALLAGALVSAQPVSEPVTLDIVVDEATASRQPLSASDFAVTEAGQPLTIQSVRLVRPSSEATTLPIVTSDVDEKTAVDEADRLIGIYVDEYHLGDDAAFAAARSALAAFVRSTLGPRDLVVVVKPLDSLVSLRMTGDREAAARVIENAAPRLGDYTPRSSFEQEFIAGSPARIDAVRNQITLSGVSAITTHLGRFAAGRKTLVVLSNGITGTVTTRGDAPLPSVESISRLANRSRVAVYLLQPSPVGPPGNTDGGGSAKEPLAAIANQTTGLVADGAGAAGAAALQRILGDASRYYLLSVTPSEGASDGRFRPVSVTVSKPVKRVRARAGYAVGRADEAIRIARPALPPGLKIPRRTSPLIRTWFGQSQGEGGATNVEFVWEPSPRVPGARGVVITPARVAITVSKMDGTEIFAGALGPSGTDRDFVTTERPQVSFDSAPGTLLVQMDVLDPAGRVLDKDVRDLRVGGFPGPLAFGTTAVFRSRTNREFRAIADGTVTAAPVASRQFSRAEHLVFRLPVVTAGELPTVTARLQSRFGGALRDLPTTTAPDAPRVFQVDLPLAALASGGYAVEFSARGAGGSAVDRVEFTVTP